MDKRVKVYLPKWASFIYGAMAVILVPWIIHLAERLPTKHIADHWDTLWVGFDIIMLIIMLITVWFMITRKVWVIVSASALATLFLVDVWFDVLTSKPGKEESEALFFGIIEISLSLLTYRLVYRVVHKATPKKGLKLTTDKRHK
jgi:hypothetical protein